LLIADSEGFQRDVGLNGEKVSFECRTTNVAIRLTELMAMADKNNRPQVGHFFTINVAIRLTVLMAMAEKNNRPQVKHFL
jgi:hypothetical protein